MAARVQTQYVFADKGAQAARLVRSHARRGDYDKAASEKAFVDAAKSAAAKAGREMGTTDAKPQ